MARPLIQLRAALPVSAGGRPYPLPCDDGAFTSACPPPWPCRATHLTIGGALSIWPEQGSPGANSDVWGKAHAPRQPGGFDRRIRLESIGRDHVRERLLGNIRATCSHPRA